MSAEHSIHQLCAAFGVSRSGYQVWVRCRPGLRHAADADLLRLLRQGHEESRGAYGRPRLLVWLAQRGHRCGHIRAWRLLNAAGLSQKRRRKFRPVSLTESDHDLARGAQSFAASARSGAPQRRVAGRHHLCAKRMKAGCMWPVFWTGARAVASAGRWASRWPPRCHWRRWTWR